MPKPAAGKLGKQKEKKPTIAETVYNKTWRKWYREAAGTANKSKGKLGKAK